MNYILKVFKLFLKFLIKVCSNFSTVDGKSMHSVSVFTWCVVITIGDDEGEIDCGCAPMTQNRRMHSLTNRIIPGALMSAEINN